MGGKNLTSRNKGRSNQSNVVMRYLAAIGDHHVNAESNDSEKARLLNHSPRSRSSYGKSVQTSKTSATGTSLDQSSEGYGTDSLLNLSNDLTTTPCSEKRRGQDFKPRKRQLQQSSQPLECVSLHQSGRQPQHLEGPLAYRSPFFPRTRASVTRGPTVVCVAERSESSTNSSLTSPRTSESPINARGKISVDNYDSVSSCQVGHHQYIQQKHELTEESLSSSSIDKSLSSRSPLLERAGFLGKSFDLAMNHGLDLILDNGGWGNCSASPVRSSCTASEKSTRRRKTPDFSKMDANWNTSGQTTPTATPTTTPTSTSSRDRRVFSLKLTPSFSSSQSTEAATEVATNRAIDIAMKRIHEIEKNGQSSVAVQEAKNFFLKKNQPARRYFAPESKGETRTMEARSLLSVSSNESSRYDMSQRLLTDGPTLLGRLDHHVEQQQLSVSRFQDENTSFQSKSMTSSMGVEIAAGVNLHTGCSSKAAKSTLLANRPLVVLPSSNASTSKDERHGTASMQNQVYDTAFEPNDKHAVLLNRNQTQKLLIPDLYEDEKRELSTIKPVQRSMKSSNQIRTFRVATPTMDKNTALIVVNPCISPPKIIRHAQSFEQQSPDPIFCTHSSSAPSSSAGAQSRAESTISHSFASDDAMFMEASLGGESIPSPATRMSVSKYHATQTNDKKKLNAGERRLNSSTLCTVDLLTLPEVEHLPNCQRTKVGKGSSLPQFGLKPSLSGSVFNPRLPKVCTVRDRDGTGEVGDENIVHDTELEVINNARLAAQDVPSRNKLSSQIRLKTNDISAHQTTAMVMSVQSSQIHPAQLPQHCLDQQTFVCKRKDDKDALNNDLPPMIIIPSLEHAGDISNSKSTSCSNSGAALKSKAMMPLESNRSKTPVFIRSKVAEKFLASISKSQNVRNERVIDTKSCGLGTPVECSIEPSDNCKRRSSLAAHLSRPDINWKGLDSDHKSIDVQSIRSAFESIQASAAADDDDTASVKSLRERFEPAPSKPNAESGIAKLRAVFETKKPPVAKRFQTSNIQLKETFSKFEVQSGRQTSELKRKGIGIRPKSAFPLNQQQKDRESDHSEDEAKNLEQRQTGLIWGSADTTRLINLKKLEELQPRGIERVSHVKAVEDKIKRGVVQSYCCNEKPSNIELLEKKFPNISRTSDSVGSINSNTPEASKSTETAHVSERRSHDTSSSMQSNSNRSQDRRVLEKVKESDRSCYPCNTGVHFQEKLRQFSGFPQKDEENKAATITDQNYSIARTSAGASPGKKAVSSRASIYFNGLAAARLLSVEQNRNNTTTQDSSPRSNLEAQTPTGLDNLDTVETDAVVVRQSSTDSKPRVIEMESTESPKSGERTTDDNGDCESSGNYDETKRNSSEMGHALEERADLMKESQDLESLTHSKNNHKRCNESKPSSPIHMLIASLKGEQLCMGTISNGQDSSVINPVHDYQEKGTSDGCSDGSVCSGKGRESISSLNNSVIKVVSDDEEDRVGALRKNVPIVVKPVARKLTVSDPIVKPHPIKAVVNPLPLNPLSSSTQITKNMLLSNNEANTKQLKSKDLGYPLPKDLQVVISEKNTGLLYPLDKFRLSSFTPAESMSCSARFGQSFVSRVGGDPLPNNKLQESLHPFVDTSDEHSEAEQNDAEIEESESEFSDGVTLDVSIAEVSNLTFPTALVSKSCDRSVSTTGEDYLSDPRTESEAKRSEASSSQTSEAAHPLLAKVMRLLPSSDEYSTDSFFKARASSATNWANSSGWTNRKMENYQEPRATELNDDLSDEEDPFNGLVNYASSAIRSSGSKQSYVEEVKDDVSEKADHCSGWDVAHIEMTFPRTHDAEEKFDLDSEWDPFDLLHVKEELQVPTFTHDPASSLTPVRNNSTRQNPPNPCQAVDGAAHLLPPRSMTRKPAHNIRLEKTWQKRAQLVQKVAGDHRSPVTQVDTKPKSTLPPRRDTPPLPLVAQVAEVKQQSSPGRAHVLSAASPRMSKHAMLLARLSKLKDSRMRRAAALQTLRPSFKFSPYGSALSHDYDDRSLGTKDSSTGFGGSSFMAALDVD